MMGQSSEMLEFFVLAMHRDVLAPADDRALLEQLKSGISLRNSVVHEGAPCGKADAAPVVAAGAELLRRVILKERWKDVDGFDVKAAIKDPEYLTRFWRP